MDGAQEWKGKDGEEQLLSDQRAVAALGTSFLRCHEERRLLEVLERVEWRMVVLLMEIVKLREELVRKGLQ